LTVAIAMPKKRKFQSRETERQDCLSWRPDLLYGDDSQEIFVDDVVVKDPVTGSEEWQFASSIRECPPLDPGFVKRWSAALCTLDHEHAEMEKYDEFWHCEAARSDLTRWDTPFWAELFSTNVPLGSQTTPEINGFLSQELCLYREHINRVNDINRAIRKIGRRLANTEMEWQQAALRVKFRDAVNILQTLASLRSRVEQFQNQYWDCLFCMGEFSVPEPKREVLYCYRALRRLSACLRVPTIRQERNLDTLFQVRVADLLLEYCNRSNRRSRVSLRTIARLVTLVYICADLVTPIDKVTLQIRGSRPQRRISVDSIYETLTDAGLRADSSRNRLQQRKGKTSSS
jgi:hypothetical protein